MAGVRGGNNAPEQAWHEQVTAQTRWERAFAAASNIRHGGWVTNAAFSGETCRGLCDRL